MAAVGLLTTVAELRASGVPADKVTAALPEALAESSPLEAARCSAADAEEDGPAVAHVPVAVVAATSLVAAWVGRARESTGVAPTVVPNTDAVFEAAPAKAVDNAVSIVLDPPSPAVVIFAVQISPRTAVVAASLVPAHLLTVAAVVIIRSGAVVVGADVGAAAASAKADPAIVAWAKADVAKVAPVRASPTFVTVTWMARSSPLVTVVVVAAATLVLVVGGVDVPTGLVPAPGGVLSTSVDGAAVAPSADAARVCTDSDPAGVTSSARRSSTAVDVAAGSAGVDDAAASGSESVAAGPTTGPAAVAEPGTVALFTALVVGAVGVPGST